MDPITERVRDMYTRYPFPSKDKIENKLPGYLPDFIKRALDKRERHRIHIAKVVAQHLAGLEQPWRVLEAGRGTGETLCEIAQHIPDVALEAVDLSPTSIERARQLLERKGFKGIVPIEHDLMQPLPFDAGRFDVISSIGVVHHLSDPVLGLRNLATCLAPEGHLVCYVYGQLGRRDLLERREVVHLLAGQEADFEQKIRTVEVLDLYPRHHRSRIKEFLYRILGFDRTTTRNVWIVDQLAHIQEKEYTISLIQEDLAAAGLSLVEFHGFPNRIEEVITDERILEDAKALSQRDRYRALELLIRPSRYLFSARLAVARPESTG